MHSGYGFLEKVYQNARAIELRKLGLEVTPEAAATVYVGLLLNFGPKAEIKRKAFDNSRKGSMRWLQKLLV